MQKTRLGVGAGLIGAAIYFMGLFSGYLVAVIIAGYVLLMEQDEWLKKTVVKALSLMILFSLCSAIINLIPNSISCFNSIISGFGAFVIISIFSRIASFAISVIDILEKVLFIILGMMALNQKTIAVPFIDKMIDKYMV